MTIRNLEHMFRPRSVALIGASKDSGSVGAVLAHNLFNGGFDGPVMPVNPKHQAIQGVLTYPDIASLPVTPELAIISTPPAVVPAIVAELAARGTKAAVVITAGFGEGEAGGGLRQALLDAARPQLLRIVGPNCLGIMVPGIGLNASFGHLAPAPGRLAFVAQSGAVMASVIDWASARGIGFSHLVSLGDMADVDFGDMLDYLANDPGTSAILLYVEAVTQARKFMSAGRAAARMKPVVVVKAGRHAEGARAAASHTGALVGSDAVYDTAFRRAGMLRVIHLEELFDAAETLAMATPPRGDRLAIVTNGGGAGVMATDALIDEGGQLAPLAAATLAELDALLPPTWSRGNPIDIIGDAGAERYRGALEVVMRDEGVDGVVVLHSPTAVASPSAAARAVAATVAGHKHPVVLTSWIGDGAALEARRVFAEHRIPSYDTPEDAVSAFSKLVAYRRNQETLIETPPSLSAELAPDTAAARAVIAAALGAGRSWLTEPEGKVVLAAYEIPVTPTRLATTPAAAAALAAELGDLVALKVVSPDILHKSDVGGVALDLSSDAVEAAAQAMLARVANACPNGRIEGISVQPMVRRPGAYELIVGVTLDRQFGPMLLFGHGGTAVEVIDDKALALPPLNLRLVRELIGRTRISRQLGGYRERPPADLDAIAATLIKVSQLVIDLAEIEELDINPLLADEKGVIALDVRIRVAPASGPATERLAIRPYPKELEERVMLPDGRELLLRPVLPEDEPAFQEAFARLTPEEIRLRFLAPLKTLSHVMAARFTQIDYDREMALVLAEPGVPGQSEVFGVARINADPDNERAEYAIIVRHDMTGIGLGTLLMQRLIGYARGRGIRQIFGDVLRENGAMLELCESMGFRRTSIEGEPTLLRVTLELPT
ncbi:MAG TPA: bifunctional acetate--CoA ligase family protein/GNAT family N-acetyltransferase [Geminicoccaceae bacterium]|nr:bifunctional acetate--CoA ligase family protein/GNAT family N-acetyltransferase [Geminicoccaceae bacterium]